MRKTLAFTIFLLAAGLIAVTSPAQQTPSQAPAAPAAQAPAAPGAQEPALKARPELPTPTDRFSYAVGMNLGSSFRKQSVPVNVDVLMKGIKDSMSGGQTLMTDDEARAAIMEVQNQLRKQQQEKMQAQGETNKKDGEAFLAANKSKEGVVTLPDGLQYKILQAGNGPKPTTADSVSVNYRGTLVNGTEFDSSYKRGQAATFPVTGVIKGWTEALQLMPVGSKWQLFIPSDLAYGERAPGDIGPNSTLIFEVELLKIADKEQAPAKQ
ncbi:MAG TPA: FKBP-type peptidyl-prolyl cis-trans isomerase [Terriglobales bacterium]